jgi:hypothetical protein
MKLCRNGFSSSTCNSVLKFIRYFSNYTCLSTSEYVKPFLTGEPKNIIITIISGRKALPSGMLSRRCELKMPSGTSHRVTLVLTDVSENLQSQSSVLFTVIGFHRCVTVESLLIISIAVEYLWSKNTLLWDTFTRVPIKDLL